MYIIPLAIGAITVGLFIRLVKISCCPSSQVHEDRMLRGHLTEKQIDRMIMDSFPASDPPSTY